MIEGGVCFDFHHTLVDPAFRLRPGMKELLDKFQKAGMTNILTTTGGGRHLQEVFRDTGIQHYFAYVLEGPEINVGRGKRYGPAAAFLGLSPREAADKMIATGDLLDDRPADIPIVFIHHPSGFQYDASLLDHLIQHLLKAGRNSFMDGFTRIMKDQSTPSSSDGVRTTLDGILVTLSLPDPTEGSRKNLPLFTPGIRIPTIRVVRADRYRRKQS
jgi:hypothetical protein